MKTLIIEDDYSANTMFVRFLENYGECDGFTTGYDGMQAYQNALNSGQPYDLIIIDIILPDMNGYTVMESIRDEESARSIPINERSKIILTTSLDDEENRKLKEKLKIGQEAYYVKNFALDGLKEKLAELGVKVAV